MRVSQKNVFVGFRVHQPNSRPPHGMQELCRALEGSRYYRFLDPAACSPAPDPAASVASSAVPKGQPVAQLQRQQPAGGTPHLLTSWCAPADKLATGWGALSDAECMQRFEAVQRGAVDAVRKGSGLMLFKHVHKVSSAWGVPGSLALCS